MTRKAYEAPAIADTAVMVPAAEHARLRRIETAATRYAELCEASRSAQAVSARGANASPDATAPPRCVILEAERELVRAVRS